MKCPKCNYTSFNHLTSCKKCGFVFKEDSGSGRLTAFKSSVADAGAGEEKEAQGIKRPDVSETVSSIQASLDEIEVDESGGTEDTRSLPQEKTVEVESAVNQLQKGDTSMEEDKKFPAFNEVNWEESVSLSSDELNLDIVYPAGEEGKKEEKVRELRFKDEEPDELDKKTIRLKEELERVGEELKGIEEEPGRPGPVSPPELPPETSFDLSTVRKGGFWIRLVAFTIDNIILNVLGTILMNIGLLAFGLGSSAWEEPEAGEVFSVIIPYLIFMFIINIAYYTYFHGNTGQTVGKMVCKLKVVQVDGNPLGYGKAFLRWAGYLVSGLVFYLGFLWAAWDKNKQAWHDKIAGTCVIKI